MHIASIYAGYSLNFLIYIMTKKNIAHGATDLRSWLPLPLQKQAAYYFAFPTTPPSEIEYQPKMIGREDWTFSVLKTIGQLLLFTRLSYDFA